MQMPPHGEQISNLPRDEWKKFPFSQFVMIMISENIISANMKSTVVCLLLVWPAKFTVFLMLKVYQNLHIRYSEFRLSP